VLVTDVACACCIFARLTLLLSRPAGKTPEEIRKTFNIKVSQPVPHTHVQHWLMP
jgi:hypothetical protein